MSRPLIALLLAVAIVLGLFAWLGSRALGVLDDRDQLVRGIEDGTAARKKEGTDPSPIPSLPRRENFEWLRVSYPEGHPEARWGGAVAATARGNFACFRRRSLTDRTWIRVIVSQEVIAKILGWIRALPSSTAPATGFNVRADDGKSKTEHFLAPAEAEALLARLGNQGEPFVPLNLAVQLMLAEAKEGEVPVNWPRAPGLLQPSSLTAGKKPFENAPLRKTTADLMKLLASDPLLKTADGPALYRVASFEVILP